MRCTCGAQDGPTLIAAPGMQRKMEMEIVDWEHITWTEMVEEHGLKQLGV